MPVLLKGVHAASAHSDTWSAEVDTHLSNTDSIAASKTSVALLSVLHAAAAQLLCKPAISFHR